MEDTIQIAIVGLGVIGGSFAWALKKQENFQVKLMGIYRDGRTLDQALAAGVIDQGELVNREILQQADLVIITLYPDDLVAFVKDHRDSFKAGAIVTDVTGVKGGVVEEVVAILPEEVDFIFGHPMAGRESQGFAYADKTVFDQANYLLTPRPANKPENIHVLTQLLTSLGFKSVRQVDYQTHDRMVAYVSQLCHILAISLINSDQAGQETADFMGDSYRDLTRIANINAPLWQQLFLHNKEALLRAMANFQDQFDLLKKALEDEDKASLMALLEEGAKRRLALEKMDFKVQNN